MKPGIYRGLSMAEYLKIPAASSGDVIEAITRCPAAGWFQSHLNPKRPANTSTESQGVGTLAHALLLENSRSQMAVIDPRDHPTEKTGNIPDGWTNKSIKSARDAAMAEGKVPVFPATAEAVENMVTAARAFIRECHEPAIRAAFEPGGGESEVVIVWEEDGVLFRARPDRVAFDAHLMVDMKTTKAVAEPDKWGRNQLFGAEFNTAAAFYRRGFARATGCDLADVIYSYLVQEQDAPHLCSLVGCDPAAIALGDARIGRGIALWKQCVKSGSFPGYPPRLAYPQPPAWDMTREAEAEGAHGIAYDPGRIWKKPERLGDEAEKMSPADFFREHG